MKKKDSDDKIIEDENISLEEKMILVLERQKELFQAIHKALKLLDDPANTKKFSEAIESSLNSLKYGNTVIQKWLASRLPDDEEKYRIN